MNIICWIIKSIKLKFTSTNRKSVTRIERFFLYSFRCLFLSTIKFFTRLFRVVKICFDFFITDVKKCFDFSFVFFFAYQKLFEFFSWKTFASLSFFASLFRFSQSFLLFFHSRSCSRRSFFQSQSRWCCRFFSFQFLTTKKQSKATFTSINQNINSFDKMHFRFKSFYSRFF